jgi:hypothetical protein
MLYGGKLQILYSESITEQILNIYKSKWNQATTDCSNGDNIQHKSKRHHLRKYLVEFRGG